eukprot:9553296-Alexandrium_andersonii.AAC.1
MSASLVGSEMCIRDRLRHVHERVAVLATCRRAVSRRPGAASTQRCAGPVSYTHLTLPTICSV